MRHINIIQTGQVKCYGVDGLELPCHGSGQDGEYQIGIPWPSPRFEIQGDVVKDLLTDLIWTRDVNPNEFPVTWAEALEQVTRWNQETFLGYTDWRLPNRKELRSLMSYQTRKPSLPADHPFCSIFLNWYWTSTSAAINPAYAWYIHLEGARMFYGRKDQSCLIWPVRGKGNELLHQSGQNSCYKCNGKETACKGSYQDGDYRYGKIWPEQRFEVNENIAKDMLTGLNWNINADITEEPVNWEQALSTIKHLNKTRLHGIDTWRLPNINELESLVDCSTHTPALPVNHPFMNVRDGYWSSTTSYFEPDWSWVLYLGKGACGVGYKPGKTFFVWPVS